MSKVKVTMLEHFNAPVKIQVQLKTIQGTILSTLERIFIPFVRKTTTYVKTAEGIKRVLDFSIKETSRPSQDLNFSDINTEIIGRDYKTSINFNNAVIKLPKLVEPSILYVDRNTIILSNLANEFLDNRTISIKLNGELISLSNELSTVITLPKNISTFDIEVSIEGYVSHYPLSKTFKLKYINIVLCSDTTICSNELVCN
jgi:hypothetical protein